MPREFIYGIQPVLHVLLAKRRKGIKLFFHRAHLTPELRQVFSLVRKEGISQEETHRHHLSQISGSTQHQGVVLEAEAYPYVPFELLLRQISQTQEGIFLILDQIQDPQNLGAILRTAECAHVKGVFFPERGSALVTPAALKASAGGAEYLSVSWVKNLARAMDELKKASVWIYGTEAGNYPRYDQQVYEGKVAFVMGSEGLGVRSLIKGKCDHFVTIPLQGKISSLNVSVATGILLFEALKADKNIL